MILFPCYRWELWGSNSSGVPSLVSDGGWTEPRSVCSSYTPKAETWDHLRSSFDLSISQVSASSSLYSDSMILFFLHVWSWTKGWSDSSRILTHIADSEVFTSSSNSLYQTGPALQAFTCPSYEQEIDTNFCTRAHPQVTGWPLCQTTLPIMKRGS